MAGLAGLWTDCIAGVTCRAGNALSSNQTQSATATGIDRCARRSRSASAPEPLAKRRLGCGVLVSGQESGPGASATQPRLCAMHRRRYRHRCQANRRACPAHWFAVAAEMLNAALALTLGRIRVGLLIATKAAQPCSEQGKQERIFSRVETGLHVSSRGLNKDGGTQYQRLPQNRAARLFQHVA